MARARNLLFYRSRLLRWFSQNEQIRIPTSTYKMQPDPAIIKTWFVIESSLVHFLESHNKRRIPFNNDVTNFPPSFSAQLLSGSKHFYGKPISRDEVQKHSRTNATRNGNENTQAHRYKVVVVGLFWPQYTVNESVLHSK